MKVSQNKNPMGLLKRVMGLMKQHLLLYSVSIIGMAAIYSIVMDVYISVIYQKLLDASFAFDLEKMKRYGIQLVLILVGACILCPLFSFFIHYCTQRVMAKVRVMVYKKAVNLPMQYYDTTHSETIISCLNNDLRLLEDLYFWPIFRVLLASLIGIASTVALLYYNPWVAVIAIFSALVSLMLNRKYSKVIHVKTNRIQELQANMAGTTMDELSSYRVSRIYSMQRFLWKKFSGYNEEQYDCKMEGAKGQATLDVFNNMLNYLGYALVCIVCLYFVYLGELSIGAAIACLQLKGEVEFMVFELGSVVTPLQLCFSGADRVFQLLDTKEEEESFQAMDCVAQKEGSPVDNEVLLKFHRVCFSYNKQEELLHDINFEVKRGSKVAIIGHNGSGKSTIYKMLLGFYPISSGVILYRNAPLDSYSKKQMRDEIAYVPQEPYLFHDTIWANIGMHGEAKEKIVVAAKTAQIHDVIMDLPQQYDTVIEEHGANLSGGQKQRIAIARALVKEANLYIFDEATSALDRELEEKIMKSIEEYSKDKTILFITHRKETLSQMDQIFCVNSGTLTCNQKGAS